MLADESTTRAEDDVEKALIATCNWRIRAMSEALDPFASEDGRPSEAECSSGEDDGEGSSRS